MKKKVKIIVIFLLSIIVVALIIGFLGWRYFNNSFVHFEDDYIEKNDFKTLTVDGHTFLDRNRNGKLDIYEDDRKSNSVRIKDLLSKMTLEEKIHLLKGSGLASAMGDVEEGKGIPGAVGTIVPTPRLGVPTVYLSDGPAGLRIEPRRKGEERTYYCTAFPIATMLASTWNENLVEKVGNAMGNEALEYGIDVILGPGVNIHRNPLCGRNFEYYSEDPVLTGNIGAAMVNGIESNGIGTSLKHFVANNQETERVFNDVIVSDRALREIYLKGFEIIVKKSQPWTIMSSYNKVNGTYTSESNFLLTQVLRDDWGFKGLVMTDWFGGKNAIAQIKAGNDLLEPGTKLQWEALTEGYENKELSITEIDIAVTRILELVFKSKKMLNHTYKNTPDLKQHAEITRQSAAEGIVLLKNEEVLPLQKNKNVALLGITSYDFIAGGTGSGDVNEAYTVSLEEGLQKAGFEINKLGKSIFEKHRQNNEEKFVKPEGVDAMFNPYLPPQIKYSKEQLSKIVETSDVGILTIGRNAGEGGDRIEENDFLLTNIEEELIKSTSEAFQSVGKKLIVVLNVGGVIETNSWKKLPDGILLAWQGGQEGGNSVADVMSGQINPSGKLPMTFPVNLNDHASNSNFPQEGEQYSLFEMSKGFFIEKKERPEKEKIKNKDYTNYDEGIYVGYRHFDTQKMKVSYPFGYGLSYSNFEYLDTEVKQSNDSIHIDVTVKNIGDYKGKEVVQIYTSKINSTISRPLQELKGFTKTKNLEAGESTRLSIDIPVNDLRYWSEEKSEWILELGDYKINIASSSRDVRESIRVSLQ